MKDTVTMLVEALQGTVAELENVLRALNGDRMPHDGDEFHDRLLTAKAALSAAKGGGWMPVDTLPLDGGSYIVASAVHGMVAPHVNGVIQNNPGTNWDWQYGEAITHWQPLPQPPKD